MFDASAIAAAARMPFRLDGHVTELARHAGHAVPDLPLKDDASTHAGSESQHGHVLHIARRAQPLFAEGGDVGVVFQDHARAQERSISSRTGVSAQPGSWAIRAPFRSACR